jgi:light-regulated signal transduction histidine kinase (bacteriophytochrome)
VEAKVDIANCDREPIHIPGATQSHGCLLACDATLETVRRHSGNAPAPLGLAESPNGLPFSDLVGGALAHDIRNALGRSRDPRRPALLFARRLASGAQGFDICAQIHEGVGIVEFEPEAETETGALDIARILISRALACETLPKLLGLTPRLMRAMLRYDRVTIYKFAEDGSGKVIAEDRRVDLESFSGQHFPASDIPAQARLLYLRNTIRVIDDVRDNGAALEPALDAQGLPPLDLSYAHLCRVSPIHLECLRNMGVAASMSASIVMNGALWGLIACHHYAPKALTLAQRTATEMFAEMFSLRVEAFERAEAVSMAQQAGAALERIAAGTSETTEIAWFLRERLPTLKALVPCDGAALVMEGAWTVLDSTPPASCLPALAEFIRARAPGRVYSTHRLSQELPEAAAYAAEAAGVLALPLSQMPRDYLVFFRREQVETVNRGGDPRKGSASCPNGDRLSPRQSFHIWKETVHLQSTPWTPNERQIAESARVQLLEIMMRHSEALGKERRVAEVRQKTLNEELNHRVKNILALVKSLVSQDIGGSREVAAFATALKGRIAALANAHDQVVRCDGGGRLSDLLRAELSPYAVAGREIEIVGPDLVLDARAYSVMALVLHELATNAAKYGPLSEPLSRLSARWVLTGAGDCELSWRETGGPPVATPSHTGFGTSLIRRSVPFDLGGESEIDYAADGLKTRLLIPARYFEDRSSQDRQAGAEPCLAASAATPVAGLRVLLVEDQFVIALDAERLLKEAGAAEVEIAATPDEAERLLAAHRPDVAVLDGNLGRVTSIPVAQKLLDLGVPFILPTGYGDSQMIGEAFRRIPVVRKPYSGHSLVAAIEEVRHLSGAHAAT